MTDGSDANESAFFVTVQLRGQMREKAWLVEHLAECFRIG